MIGHIFKSPVTDGGSNFLILLYLYNRVCQKGIDDKFSRWYQRKSKKYKLSVSNQVNERWRKAIQAM